MIAAPARSAKWVDTSVPVSADVCTSVRARGYAGVVRYVPLPRNSPAWDISAAELQRLTLGGVQVLLVQHSRSPNWRPALCSGSDDALIAISSARLVGYPDDAHLYCDCEGPHATTAEMTAYLNAWSTSVLAAGYRAGLYVGYGVPLDGDQLYELPGFTSYWSDAGHRHVSRRGCAMVQGGEVHIAGTLFDENDLAPDALGEIGRAHV